MARSEERCGARVRFADGREEAGFQEGSIRWGRPVSDLWFDSGLRVLLSTVVCTAVRTIAHMNDGR